MRRFGQFGSLPRVGAAAIAPAMRSVIYFSPQLDKKVVRSSHLYDSSKVWIEAGDVERNGLELIPDARKEEVWLSKSVELYNGDQLEGLPEELVANHSGDEAEHINLMTNKVYRGRMKEELSQRCAQHGWNSRIWVNPRALAANGLRILSVHNGQTSWIPSNFKGEVVHSSQLTEPEKLIKFPVYGFSKVTPRSLDERKEMIEFQEANNFETGLFFTPRQVRMLGLETLEEAKPLKLKRMLADRARGTPKYYPASACVIEDDKLAANVESAGGIVEDLIKRELNARVDVATLRLIVPAGRNVTLPEERAWISEKTIEGSEGRVRLENPEEAEAAAVKFSGARVHDFEWFNAEQLNDPRRAYQMAGCYTC